MQAQLQRETITLNHPDTMGAKISVIVPLYNVEEYIETTIEELLKQTYKNVEFILVDDGSSDRTYDIASYYATQYPQIRVVKQQNQGPSAARNHGLRLATGDYLCFVDSDDVLPEDALEIMYKAAIEHDADLVMGPMVRFNSKKRWFISIQVQKGVNKPGEKTIFSHPGLLYAMGPCAKLYKRELVKNIYFPEHIRLGEDQPFVLHAYLNAKRIYTVDSVVYHYRAREGDNASLTQTALHSPLESLNDLYEMVAMANKQLAPYPDLQAYYLERVIRCDIWPRCRSAIVSGTPDIQEEALTSVCDWVRSMDDGLFNRVPSIAYVLLAGSLIKFKHLSPRAYRAYGRLLATVLSKMDLNNFENLFATGFIRVRKKTKNWYHRRVRNPLKQKLTKLQNVTLRRVVFPVTKRLPLRSKKIVLASNKSEQLQGNLLAIYNKLSETDWQPCLVLKQNRNFWQKCNQYYHLGTARVIVIDDYYPQLYGLHARPESEVIQVWHASGAFKKFGISSVGSRDSNSLDFELRAHSAITKAVVSSATVIPHYAEAFNLRQDQVLPLGVPQTDVFFDSEYMRSIKGHYLSQYPAMRDKKILLYAPTFRGRPKERRSFQLKLDIEYMKEHLADSHILLLKLHPAVRQSVRIPEHLADFVMDFSRVPDISELLLISDLLITDYSSIIFDYSLLRRPMVFYAYDLDSYLSERGFYYEYETFVPGPIARTTAEVVDYIVKGQFPLDVVEQFSNKFFDHRDGKSTERFIETFLRSMDQSNKVVRHNKLRGANTPS
jgi:CDP-ribitol ribitolphosphotransferase